MKKGFKRVKPKDGGGLTPFQAWIHEEIYKRIKKIEKFSVDHINFNAEEFLPEGHRIGAINRKHYFVNIFNFISPVDSVRANIENIENLTKALPVLREVELLISMLKTCPECKGEQSIKGQTDNVEWWEDCRFCKGVGFVDPFYYDRNADRIWFEVDKVYETRWDCSIQPDSVRLAA